MQKINGRVTGWGAYTPSRVLTNDDLSTFLDTNDEWIVRRTDHDPDTGMIEASAYVDQDEAATAGEKYCADMEFDIPPSIRSGKYDTIEDIRDSDGERRADEARIEGDAA